MRHLCDSNVLLASLLPSHPHHRLARNWMQSLGRENSAGVCRPVQVSLLRLLTTEAVMREEVRTNNQAMELWNALADFPGTEFVNEEPPGLQEIWFRLSKSRAASPKMWIDAYLAAFAIGYSLKLVTFDRGFESYRKSGLDLQVLQA